jgi:integrase
MLTGMRQGELMGLMRMNVDLKRKTLTKTHIVYRGQRLEGTKNTSGDGKVRQPELQMSDLLCEVLQKALDLNPAGKPTDYVFSVNNGEPLDPDHFRNYVLYPAIEKLGIERSMGTHGLHMLRHTAGSLVFNSTGNMKAAQEQLGHSNMQTTANIYIHTDSAQKQLSANVLAEPLADFATHLATLRN